MASLTVDGSFLKKKGFLVLALSSRILHHNPFIEIVNSIWSNCVGVIISWTTNANGSIRGQQDFSGWDGNISERRLRPLSVKYFSPVKEVVFPDDPWSLSADEYTSAVLFPLIRPVYPVCRSVRGQSRVCRERSQCFYVYSLGVYVRSEDTCLLRDDRVGVCCPENHYHGVVATYANDDRLEGDQYEIANMFTSSVNEGSAKAMKDIERLRNLESSLQNSGYLNDPNQLRPRGAKRPGVNSEIVVRQKVYEQVVKEMALERPVALYRHMWNSSLTITCQPPTNCPLSPYSRLNGTCNNFKYPLWGSANSTMNRRLSPQYADGLNSPRLTNDGNPLPNPRLISWMMSPSIDNPHHAVTHVITIFGQFLSHDMASVPNIPAHTKVPLECCSVGGGQSPGCYPVIVPFGDPLLNNKNTSCIHIKRSKAAMPEDCKISWFREQINQATTFIDASTIYGSSEAASNKLRKLRNGLMKTSVIYEESFPPFADYNRRCGDANKGIKCFMTGDGRRANQHPGILIMHILWLREHNRIAKRLNRLNQHWDDQRVFEEARRVVIAEIAHITFNEYLPLLLDVSTRRRHHLVLQASGYSNLYDPNVKPALVNEFSTAAYRMGHSLVQDKLMLVRNDHYVKTVKLDDHFFNPQLFYNKFYLEMMLEGYMTDSAQFVDKYFATGLTQKLFKSKVTGLDGKDLVSINIQRGRDHGLAPYNAWRELCGRKRAQDFDQLTDVIPYDSVEQLKKIYNNVNDIDLYVGGILEYHVVGGIIGPTFSCIIADQFRRLRTGDRFWYERYSQREGVGFLSDQLKEIRKTTLARILCDNTRIGLLQPLVFLKPGQNNIKISCRSPGIPKTSLVPWISRK